MSTISASTTSTTAYKVTADTTGTLVLQTGSSPTTAVTIDTSQNVGLGVTPSAWGGVIRAFEGYQASSGSWSIASGGGLGSAVNLSNNTYYDGSNWIYKGSFAASNYYQNAGAHAWRTAASGTAGGTVSFTQAMTLDASGNLGVGETAPSTPLGGSRGLVLKGSSDTQIRLQNTNSGSTSSDGLLLSVDGSATPIAYLWNYENSPLVFGTNNTERARITSGGYSKFSNNGSYTNASGTFHEFNNNVAGDWGLVLRSTTSNTPYGMDVYYSAVSPNNTGSHFFYAEDTSALRFSVRSNGGIANYSANDVNLSDRREKTNFAPAGEYLSKICAIPIQTFNYIDQNMEEDDGLTLGVVAQDVQAVAPELVMESNWAEKGEEPKMRLSIYQTDLQYALMKCIQEQQAIIETLTNRITALEAK